MKKVICAAAAFAMVAGVATVASAEVKLSGSARTRLIYVDDGSDTGGVDKWDSRVRFKMHATTEGGGYVKARLRLLDGSWGTGADYTALAKGDKNVWSDYAFVGFKTGNIDVAGGKMDTSFSPWFVDDERADRFRVLYKEGGLALAFTYDNKVSNGGFSDDKNVWGVTYRQKFSDAVKANLRVVYVADGLGLVNPDGSDKDMKGFKGSANLAMNFGGNNIILEQSYKAGATAGFVPDAAGNYQEKDDQYGGYAEWNATFGSITPVARVGYTKDGFVADETFGWLMVGGDVPTSRFWVGEGGDTVFVGLSSKFQTTEALSFQANAVYMDIDESTGMYGNNPFELSGQAKYKVGKGVALLARAGWLSSDADDVDDAFAAYGQMEVTF